MRIAMRIRLGLPLAAMLSLVCASTSLAAPKPVFTYTGDAYNLSVTGTLLGNPLTPITLNEVGPIDTTTGEGNRSKIMFESVPLLGLTAKQFLSTVFTGQGRTKATTRASGVKVLTVPGSAPPISTGGIRSSSLTKCDKYTGALTTVGLATVGFIQIGTQKIRVAHNPTPPNDTVSLGSLGSVTFNEETPTTDGLSVNAVDLNLTTSLGPVEVIIGHAESGLDNC
jgi:hypothetical protein